MHDVKNPTPPTALVAAIYGQAAFLTFLNAQILPIETYILWLILIFSKTILKHHKNSRVFFLIIGGIWLINHFIAGEAYLTTDKIRTTSCVLMLLLFFLTPSVQLYRNLLLFSIFILGLTLYSSNSIVLFLFIIIATISVLALLFSLEQLTYGSAIDRYLFRRLSIIFLQTMPFIIILYFIIPMIVSRDLNEGKSAYSSPSNTITPGKIAEIVETKSPVFEVKIAKDKIPKPQNRYWRTSVHEQSLGLSWRKGKDIFEEKKLKTQQITKKQTIEQQFLLDLTISALLPGLDPPISYPLPSEIKHPENDPLGSFRYKVISSLKPVKGVAPSKIKTTARMTSAIKSLINDFKARTSNSQEYAQAVMEYFQQNNFIFTLRPGLTNSLDHFLFTKKKGFCEHYAASMATLIQLGGYRARVISGFQGGELHINKNTIEVYTNDAHAWLEVWLPETKIWQRYDPTQVIAPDRLLFGGQRYFSPIEQSIFSWMIPNSSKERLWNFYRNSNRLVKQLHDILDSFLENIRKLIDALGVTGFLAIGILALTIILFNFINNSILQTNKRLERIWVQFVTKLKKTGTIPPGSNPDRTETLNFINNSQAPYKKEAAEFVSVWLEKRFGPKSKQNAWKTLRKLLKTIR